MLSNLSMTKSVAIRHPRFWWQLISVLIASIVVIPLLIITSSWMFVSSEIWQHLASTTLPSLLRNTIVLAIGTGVGVVLLGVSLAWLTTFCEFPGRRIFDWALMLPLAMPTYVLAFVMLGLLDFAGPVQTTLREWFGRGNFWFPDVRSEGGIIVVMVLALYPYVYMLTRVAFVGQGRTLMEAARSLGLNPWQAFFKVALPMARPAIAAGTALALMETLADFGAVSVFNYDTFTTAIYKAWYGFFNLQAAAQLASLLMLFSLLALLTERYFRGHARYHSDNRQHQRFRLTGWRAVSATGFAATVFACAFLIPLVQLALWSWEIAAQDWNNRYFSLLWHTLLLGVTAALCVVSAAVLLRFSLRIANNVVTRWSAALATLGYALPGSVLAVGIMLSFVWVDKQIQTVLGGLGIEIGLLLSGSVVALLLAYTVRFLAVAYGPIDSRFQQIRPSLHESAQSLGASYLEILYRLYLPLLRPGLFTGLLLVFVDVMKEMPATLLLRPFNWDTLAVRIYEMTSEGEWERAALPALTLVLAGLLPVILLVRRASK